ncbi:MAG: ABC transporter permease [Nitrospinota bacterium]
MEGTTAPTTQEFEDAQVLRRSHLRLHAGDIGVWGGAILLVFVLAALFAPILTSYDPSMGSLASRLVPPWSASSSGFFHPLGTDTIGRDMLARILFGTRLSLFVGFTSALLATVVGTIVGLLAGYAGGKTDKILMRITDMQISFPSLLLAIVVLYVIGGSILNLILVLAITRWVDFARIIRGEVLSLKEREFVEGARALGNRASVIIFKHILPNVGPTIIVIGTITMARTIYSEAALSFLGLGIPPPTPTLGDMVAEGRKYLARAWWVTTFPGLAITLIVLGANLLGDWIRDRTDPTLRNRVDI